MLGYLGLISTPSVKIKKFNLKKLLIFFRKKNSYIFPEIFPEKKTSYILGGMLTKCKISYTLLILRDN